MNHLAFRSLIISVFSIFMTIPAFGAEGQQPLSSETGEISSRGLSIGGCEITYNNMLPDFDRLKNCVAGQIDKIKDDAKDTVDAANRKAQNLQAEINTLKSSPQLARLQSEIKTLDAVRRMQLEPLFSCLATTGQGSADFPQLVNRFIASPAEFSNWLMTGMMAQWEQHFSEIMAEQLQLLRTPSKAVMQPAPLIDSTFRTMEKLIKKDPAAACLWQFTGPQLTPLRNTALQLAQNTMSQGRRIFDSKIFPILTTSINQQLSAVLMAALSLPPSSVSSDIRPRGIESTSGNQQESIEGTIASRGMEGEDAKKLLGSLVPELGEIKRLVQGVLAEHLLNPKELVTASGQLRNLSMSLATPGSSDVHLQALRRSLDPNSEWTEALYIDIGMEILRLVGNRYIESDEIGGGGFLIGKAVATLNIGEVTVGGVVQSAAGLVPEAGSFAAFLVREGPDAVFQMTIPDLITKTAKGSFQFGYNILIDEAKKALKQGRPYDTIKQQVGLFALLLPYLPSKQQVVRLADTHTQDVKAALVLYNENVIRLAEAAARR